MKSGPPQNPELILKTFTRLLTLETMENWPTQNSEFRINPENFHLCVKFGYTQNITCLTVNDYFQVNR